MQTVYVDILIFTNFLIDYFLLLLTASLSKLDKKRWRLIISAAVASLSSLLIFAPELSAVAEICINLAVSAVIVLIAFGFKNHIRFLKNTVIFYAANVILAGGTLLFWSLFKVKGTVVRNGAVFYNVSPATLVITTAAVYAVATIVSKIVKRRQCRQAECDIILNLDGKSVTLSGLVDSGNLLRDMLTGNPVIVCSFDKVKSLFDDRMQYILSKKNFEMGFYEDIINSGFSSRFRLIPFDALGSSGIMTAFVLDSASIKTKNREEKIDDVIMAITHKKIASGEFDVLISPELVTV